MKKILSTMAVLAAIGSALPAHAADKKVMMPIAGAMEDNGAKERLGDSIKFYFGTQKTPKVLEKRGSDQTSQKTNAFAKSDQAVCHWAFLSAMLALQKRAQEVGADAVINITSNYKNIPYSSETDFECHVGNVVGGVALKGDFVRLAGGKK
ncbi:excinuclease ATPase subunit [Massilia atriviolacea]|uniref:Excinuclease ATPase subunit n=1 Tax=Massilia atriviolacea TaxID=2495579 RepID=A0A430HRT2_9BURK|nr:excinuclease ATPase subunit [Massilia atriviolacea]RSZ60231.1 excinuclease ATPase subunit [Massilia atriviolacea]